MFAPVIRKLVEKNTCFVERCLPVKGILNVNVGDQVKPFDKLGECSCSQKELILPDHFTPTKYTAPKKFYYSGETIGKVKGKPIQAPFNGDLLFVRPNNYTFRESEHRYVLLSGVWGIVDKIVPDTSVLVKTQTKDLLLVAATPFSVAGELVVFPNPMEILEKFYLESFSKSNEGKIIYVGHYADLDLVTKAFEMGAVGILAGSAHRDTFKYAKEHGLGFGLISGFGKLETPEQIFKFLSVISYRYVFFEGDSNILRIPNSMEDSDAAPKKLKTTRKTTALASIKKVTKGVDVQVFQEPYVSKIGSVDRTTESSIFVKFDKEKEAVEIQVPNFFIIE